MCAVGAIFKSPTGNTASPIEHAADTTVAPVPSPRTVAVLIIIDRRFLEIITAFCNDVRRTTTEQPENSRSPSPVTIAARAAQRCVGVSDLGRGAAPDLHRSHG